MIKIINFLQNAYLWFKNANPKTKRLIIETAGSNLLLKDKILLIQA